MLLLLTRPKALERALTRVTTWALTRWTGRVTRDFAQLLWFSHSYGTIGLAAKEGDWLASRPLSQLGLPEEGVVVLGLHRASSDFLGAPTGKTEIHAGDSVLASGRLDHLQELDDRHRGVSGDRAHPQAVEQQHHLIEELDETNG